QDARRRARCGPRRARGGPGVAAAPELCQEHVPQPALQRDWGPDSRGVRRRVCDPGDRQLRVPAGPVYAAPGAGTRQRGRTLGSHGARLRGRGGGRGGTGAVAARRGVAGEPLPDRARELPHRLGFPRGGAGAGIGDGGDE
ncbi:unnamed protein product, partial [Prorocentrum cordatum]